ncbi:MAG: sigma-70 family RNA polymerase sigma factor [Calditrichaeota bacterium]|nr:MAG: sigma-70 family RNA polymerase sigma factor [Calditrichota bacterium]
MSYSDLRNNDLIQFLVKNNNNQLAWEEFYNRFIKHICRVTVNESKFRNFQEGMNDPVDIAHEVMTALINNKCHALKCFKGKHENSIYTYLQTTTIRIILNKIKKDGAQKRPPNELKRYLESPIADIENIDMKMLKDILPDPGSLSEIEHYELIEVVNFCIKKVASKRRHSYQYLMIFTSFIEWGLTSREIAQLPNVPLGWKRIENIVSEMRKGVRECLKSRL